MKVLQINSVCGVGSTGRIVIDVDKILKDQGHESYVAYGRNFLKSYNSSIRIGNRFDNYSHVFRTRLFDKHGFGSKQATREFINRIDDINPDIIHLHNIHGYYINIELLFKYLQAANKPVIWTLHDCWAFTGHCTHFDYIGCKKWKDICYECPQKTSYPSSILMDNSKENFIKKKELFTGIENMTIVTPSKWLARIVKGSFLGKYPVNVIHNGIDLNVFKPIKNNFREKYKLTNKFIILGVANIWEEKKGFNYFLDLSREIKKNESIVMVGLTKKQKAKLPKNIIGVPRTNSTKELAEIYSEADVLINPTLEDNFPTTNLEALACGTPVITFDTGGSSETISEDTGFIVAKEDLKELMKKIQIVKERGKLKYLKPCVKRANNLYNKEEKFIEYINLYNRKYL